MKIAFVSGIFFPQQGGVQVQVHNFANKLIKLGHDIKLFLYNKTNIKNNNYDILIFNKLILNIVFFFKYYLKIDLSIILKFYIISLIKKYRFDVWHFNFTTYKSLLLIDVLKNLKQKIIVTFHGADIQIDRSINYGYRIDSKYNKLLNNVIFKVDKFIYLSKTIKDDLLKIGIQENKLIYLPNCINLNKFNIQIKNIDNAENIIKLLTVARFAEKKKGYDNIEKILKLMIEKKIKFKWKIIGENVSLLLKNNFINKNRNYFDIINTIENIEEEYFPHSKLIQHYQNSDLYVNLSRIESFGVTYIESLASKVPIISFVSKGSNELVIDNFNGFLIRDNNQSELVDKICELSQNKSIMKNMKKNCIDSVQKFDLDFNSIKLTEIYKKLKTI